jgi:hypothetical protein
LKETLQAARNASAKVDELARSLGLPVSVGGGEGNDPENALPGGTLTAEQMNRAQQELDRLTARSQRLLDEVQRRPGSQAAAFLAAARQGNGRVGDLTGFMSSEKREGIVRRREAGEPISGPSVAPPALPSGFEAAAMPGRSVTRRGGAGTSGAEWMFVDSWYILGPFPNPNRKNIDTVFGPEKLLDLDATYPGKGGQTIGWKFHQAHSSEIRPPVESEYAVYYFYTELNFEDEGDHWLAIGSDDKSNLWVNGQLVWVSANDLKGWQAGEGLRRVHLTKGKNRLLLRVENGWLGVSASLVLRVR